MHLLISPHNTILIATNTFSVSLTSRAKIIRYTERAPRRFPAAMTNLIRNLFCTSLGKKYIMALTGFSMVLFVVGHLAGNLQVFGRPEMINRYGDFLQHF